MDHVFGTTTRSRLNAAGASPLAVPGKPASEVPVHPVPIRTVSRTHAGGPTATERDGGTRSTGHGHTLPVNL